MEFPNKPLVRVMLDSLLVCWLIFHSVSFLLLKKKKSAINKMYFCNFHVYIYMVYFYQWLVVVIQNLNQLGKPYGQCKILSTD